MRQEQVRSDVRRRDQAEASFVHEGFRQRRWHLDEIYVKINGEMHYLWRAVDHEGEVLESFATKTRDKAAALPFMKKAMKRYGNPEAIVTDGLRSYGARLKTRTCRSDDENEPCSASVR